MEIPEQSLQPGEKRGFVYLPHLAQTTSMHTSSARALESRSGAVAAMDAYLPHALDSYHLLFKTVRRHAPIDCPAMQHDA